MQTKVNTVDAEQFRGTKFFTLTPHKWGNRAKVRDPEAHGAYMAALQAEIEEAKRTGSAPSRAAVAVDGSAPRTNGNGKTGADTSKASLSASKALLVSPPLDELNAYMAKIKDQVCGRFGPAQQSKVLEGIYVVKDELIQDVDATIEEANARLNGSWIDPKTGETQPGYIDAFLDDIPAAIERSRTYPLLKGGLGPLFDPADYEGLRAKLESRFSLECLYIALGIPEDLPPALKAKAAEKFEAKVSAAAEEVTTALYCSLGGFLDNLTDKLAPTEDGKPKVFRDSLIENVRQFCACFDARNFTKDAQLEELVNKCRAILSDSTITPDNVRKYSEVRENTRAKFAEIQEALNGAIETRKARAFDFSE